MQLRPYQQSACDAALTWLRASIDPCLIDAAPASGKSYMIAYIANQLHQISGKRVLCLAPSAELVKQNHEKFLLTGEKASIFSASAGTKSTRHVVVFATPGTVKNAISRFCKGGGDGFCAVVCDEAHGMTPTIRDIIDAMREANPRLRVLGLSGTPYRLGTGYIYRIGPDDRAHGDDVCRDPYFTKCVYRVSAREMLEQGFITPMVIGAINSEAYDTSGVELLPNGTLNHHTVEMAFVGHGRLTASIVADAMAQARDRKGGVMYFAATVRHAEEVLASLPPETSALVTGETTDRASIIKRYREGKIRHLVSVGTLTTGFDVAHTETIVLLRYTESAALLQQILGRAWRLHPDKADCLLLDYAGNVARHFPDGDIYNPKIKAGPEGGNGAKIEAECPDCAYTNEFTVHPDYVDYTLDRHGYCMDVFGQPLVSEHGQIPGHLGRRCFGIVQTGPSGEYTSCNYRWGGKPCPECEEVNDISARYCYVCKAEIVDPNEKLIGDFKSLKRDPTRPQTDAVLKMEVKEGVSAKGNRTIRVDWVTYYRHFSVWFSPDSAHPKPMAEYHRFNVATSDGTERPATVSYVKERDSNFYRVLAYNAEADEEPPQRSAA